MCNKMQLLKKLISPEEMLKKTTQQFQTAPFRNWNLEASQASITLRCQVILGRLSLSVGQQFQFQYNCWKNLQQPTSEAQTFLKNIHKWHHSLCANLQNQVKIFSKKLFRFSYIDSSTRSWSLPLGSYIRQIQVWERVARGTFWHWEIFSCYLFSVAVIISGGDKVQVSRILSFHC